MKNHHIWKTISSSKSWSRVILQRNRPSDLHYLLDSGSYVLWSPVPAILSIRRDRKEGDFVRFTTLYFWHNQLKEFIQANTQASVWENVSVMKFLGSWESNVDLQINPAGLSLKEGQWKDILDDVELFISRRHWYRDRGIRYRRGYLFYGPPGTGKTSLASAITYHLGGQVAICQALKFKKLIESLENTEWLEDCVFLIDDIDELLRQDDFNLGQLLSALDNFASTGSIIILTCNDPSKLPPKLIRPGRIDQRWKLDFADDQQILTLFFKFFPTWSNVSKKFLIDCRSVDRPISPAELQEFLLTCRTIKDTFRVGDFLRERVQIEADLQRNFNQGCINSS